MLFADIDPNVWLYATCFLGPLLVVFILLWAYNRRENRRRRAIDLATEFGSWGLPQLSGIFTAYAVGDYSGLLEKINALREQIQGRGLPDEFRNLFEKLLDHFAKDPVWRDKIQKAIDAAAVITGTTTPTA